MKFAIITLALMTAAIVGCNKEQPPQSSTTPAAPISQPAPAAAPAPTAPASDASKATSEAPKPATESSKESKK